MHSLLAGRRGGPNSKVSLHGYAKDANIQENWKRGKSHAPAICQLFLPWGFDLYTELSLLRQT